MKTLVSLRGGGFSYGERSIFRGVDLDVMSGQVLCLLGANGCGKTTLLRCLSGSLSLNQGTVHLDGQLLSSLEPDQVARKIGFVFQEHRSPFPFSVLEVVRMGRAPHLRAFSSPSRRDTEIAERMLTRVGMLHLKSKPYTHISGGERQLVLIARTLAQEPEVIMLDEPTSHLDFRNQNLVLRIVNQLADNGMAVLMTSHMPDHALWYSDQVALMHDGHLITMGPPSEVMTESSLRETYDMNVQMPTIIDARTGEALRVVLPERNSYAPTAAAAR